MSYLLRLHGLLFVVSLPYMDDEWSSSERELLSLHTERADTLSHSCYGFAFRVRNIIPT